MHIFNFGTADIARKNARHHNRDTVDMLINRDITRVVDVKTTMSDAELKAAVVKNARYFKAFINWAGCAVVYPNMNKKQRSIINNLHRKFRIAVIR